ncbi:hypothetical protein CDAR_475311 [Caerostris darwini]|uniref:Uncharacterized protein n=1 Tax=Caerostris darwini TaxID=1538125 RepID=A0AAV4V6L9_9ARAC|nr:hypothetical protein CDAR_475311 [Caerostris darwini]
MGYPLNLAFPPNPIQSSLHLGYRVQQQRKICIAGKPRTVYEVFDLHNSRSQPCSLDFSAPLSHIGKNTCRSLARTKISFSLALSFSQPRTDIAPIHQGVEGRVMGGSSAQATETSQRHCMENRL